MLIDRQFSEVIESCESKHAISNNAYYVVAKMLEAKETNNSAVLNQLENSFNTDSLPVLYNRLIEIRKELEK